MHVAIIGFGCFGRALAGLIRENGGTVVGFDSNSQADAAPFALADSMAEAVAGADVVVVAVPVPVFERVLGQLRPHLGAEQLVLDVGSVKVAPSQAMSSILGAEIPWVATHPLFGPNSMAMGDWPLRVIVCPNPQQSQALERARNFYQGLGCRILEQSADEHDKTMADCHALTFFVAKGLMDAAVNLSSPFAPPSAKAIAKTVREVRSDSGHLFEILHRENPFAADARGRFLEALTRIDRALASAERVESGASSLVIPALDEASPQLREARSNIDKLDEQLLNLLARRVAMARRAGSAKAELGHGVRDPQREAILLDTRRAHAVSLGMDPDSVEDIFQAILRFSRSAQRS